MAEPKTVRLWSGPLPVFLVNEVTFDPDDVPDGMDEETYVSRIARSRFQQIDAMENILRLRADSATVFLFDPDYTEAINWQYWMESESDDFVEPEEGHRTLGRYKRVLKDDDDTFQDQDSEENDE